MFTWSKPAPLASLFWGFTVCGGALAFERGLSGYGNRTEVLRSFICCVWKVYRLSYRGFRFCQGSRVLRMAFVLTRDRYFLVKIGVICKNGGVGIGACVVGGGLCCSCFRSNAASCGARLVCCCGSMAALRFVCCLKGAPYELGRYSAY